MYTWYEDARADGGYPETENPGREGEKRPGGIPQEGVNDKAGDCRLGSGVKV